MKGHVQMFLADIRCFMNKSTRNVSIFTKFKPKTKPFCKKLNVFCANLLLESGFAFSSTLEILTFVQALAEIGEKENANKKNRFNIC